MNRDSKGRFVSSVKCAKTDKKCCGGNCHSVKSDVVETKTYDDYNDAVRKLFASGKNGTVKLNQEENLNGFHYKFDVVYSVVKG